MLDTVAVALLENGHHAGVKTVIIAVLAALVLSTLLTHVLKMLQKQDEREITRQSTGARFHSVIRDQHISWRTKAARNAAAGEKLTAHQRSLEKVRSIDRRR